MMMCPFFADWTGLCFCPLVFTKILWGPAWMKGRARYNDQRCSKACRQQPTDCSLARGGYSRRRCAPSLLASSSRCRRRSSSTISSSSSSNRNNNNKNKNNNNNNNKNKNNNKNNSVHKDLIQLSSSNIEFCFCKDT